MARILVTGTICLNILGTGPNWNCLNILLVLLVTTAYSTGMSQQGVVRQAIVSAVRQGGLTEGAGHQPAESRQGGKRGVHRHLLQAITLEGEKNKMVEEEEDNDPSFPVDAFTLDQRRHGAVVCHIIGVLYMYLAIILICDKYLVPSLEVFVERLGWSEDVVGSVLLGGGLSVSGLVATVIGIFVSAPVTSIGSIVGSGVFHFTFVLGMCSMFAKNVEKLSGTIIRDFIHYSIAVLLLVAFFLDNSVQWWESLVLLGQYAVYCIVVRYQGSIGKLFCRLLPSHRGVADTRSSQNNGKSAEEPAEELELEPQQIGDSENQPVSLAWPDTTRSRLLYLLELPVLLPLWLTLPDPNRPSGRKWFYLSYVGSILWLVLFHYLLIWWATVIGETLGVPPQVMGLTVIAVATCIPSVVVARKGHVQMAVSSTLGANIFHITVSLPLPWILYSIVFGTSIYAISGGLACSVGLLFILLILTLAGVLISRWRLTKKLGTFLFILYFLLVAVSLAFTYQFIMCPV